MSIRIETDRLILRTPVMEDAAAITAAMQPVWQDLQLWMSWSYDGANRVESIKENFIAKAEANNFIIGLCKDTGAFVISTGISPRDDATYETGYWVAKDFLGKGYATEATKAVIQYGFQALGINTVYTCHYEGNAPSRRVMEKLGFTKTGIRCSKQARCLDGALVDVHEYILTNPERAATT